MKERSGIDLCEMPAEEKGDYGESYREAAAYGEERSHGAHGDLSKQKRTGPQRERYGYQYLAFSFIHLNL